MRRRQPPQDEQGWVPMPDAIRWPKVEDWVQPDEVDLRTRYATTPPQRTAEAFQNLARERWSAAAAQWCREHPRVQGMSVREKRTFHRLQVLAMVPQWRDEAAFLTKALS
jgi:hypothetical protein